MREFALIGLGISWVCFSGWILICSHVLRVPEGRNLGGVSTPASRYFTPPELRASFRKQMVTLRLPQRVHFDWTRLALAFPASSNRTSRKRAQLTCSGAAKMSTKSRDQSPDRRAKRSLHPL